MRKNTAFLYNEFDRMHIRSTVFGTKTEVISIKEISIKIYILLGSLNEKTNIPTLNLFFCIPTLSKNAGFYSNNKEKKSYLAFP